MSLKFFRKPQFSLLLTFIFLTFSCTSIENDKTAENQKFDYTGYKTFNKTDFNKYFGNTSNSSARISQSLENSITLINNDFQTDLTINQLDSELIANYEDNIAIQPYEVIETYLSNTQKDLLNSFETDVNQNGFDIAIENLQQNVIDLNLSSVEFEKYNSFVNILLLINNHNPDFFSQGGETSKISPCAKAIAANVLATIGLASCGTGFLCGVAIAAKILAVDAVIDACG